MKERNKEREPIFNGNGSVIPSDNSWRGSSELEEVEFCENITQIRSGAFENCTALTTVILPKSLRYIDANAFAGCTALQEVVYPNTLEEVEVKLSHASSLSGISSEELVEYLKKGYPIDFCPDHWR